MTASPDDDDLQADVELLSSAVKRLYLALGVLLVAVLVLFAGRTTVATALLAVGLAAGVSGAAALGDLESGE